MRPAWEEVRHTRASWKASLLLLLWAIPACSADGPSPDPASSGHAGGHEAGQPADPEGVVQVDNPGAGLWEDAESPPVRFEADGMFGGPSSHVVNIAGAVVDNQANVYVYDAELFEISAFASDGTLMWRAGSSGTSADQFAGVRGITYDGDRTIWVVNQNGMRLDAWGVDGGHLRSLDLEELGIGRSFMGGFLSANRIALLVDIVYATAANEYVVLQLGESPQIETRFRIGAEPMTPIPPGVVLQLSHTFDDDKIYVGGWENYALRMYDDQGNLQRRVTRAVDYLRRPGFAALGDRYLGVSFGGLAAPIILENGYWLVLASWPANVDDPNAYAELPAAERPPIEWASSLDLFDPQGRFLYSLRSPGTQTPEIGRPWAVGPEGRLYTVAAEPVPHVRRYRVVLDSPIGP